MKLNRRPEPEKNKPYQVQDEQNETIYKRM